MEESFEKVPKYSIGEIVKLAYVEGEFKIVSISLDTRNEFDYKLRCLVTNRTVDLDEYSLIISIIDEDGEEEEYDSALEVNIEDVLGEYQIRIVIRDETFFLGLEEATEFSRDIQANVVAAMARNVYNETFE